MPTAPTSATRMGQKAENGGTSPAPRWLHKRAGPIDGHEIRTVVVDEERAPCIRLAFELAATGEYTIRDWLRSWPSAAFACDPRPTGPLRRSRRNTSHACSATGTTSASYTYLGEEYHGGHRTYCFPRNVRPRPNRARRPPCQDWRTSAQAPSLSEEHCPWCGRCHQKGVESQLILKRAEGQSSAGSTGTSSVHPAKTDECDAPYIRSEDAEAAVLRHYATLLLPAGSQSSVRANVRVHAARQASRRELMQKHLIEVAPRPRRQGREPPRSRRERRNRSGQGSRRGSGPLRRNARGSGPNGAISGHGSEAGAAVVRAALDLLDDPARAVPPKPGTCPPATQPGLLRQALRRRRQGQRRALIEPFDGLAISDATDGPSQPSARIAGHARDRRSKADHERSIYPASPVRPHRA